MRRSRTLTFSSLFLGAVALTGIVVAAQAGLSLRVNGQVASTDDRIINGRAYVPVADVAKAFGQSVVKNGNGYELAAAGGANALGGFSGKEGDVVFTGKWRFQVLGWKRAQRYQPTLSTRNTNEVEASSGRELIVVDCRVKNGLKTADELVFDERWEGMNTSITAQDEANYPPRRYDVKETHGVPGSAAFLPGGAIAFKIVFEVPKGTAPKDLVFTAMRFDMCTPGNQKKDPPQNIRVALKSDAE